MTPAEIVAKAVEQAGGGEVAIPYGRLRQMEDAATAAIRLAAEECAGMCEGMWYCALTVEEIKVVNECRERLLATAAAIRAWGAGE